jgi:hypothetical protein
MPGGDPVLRAVRICVIPTLRVRLQRWPYTSEEGQDMTLDSAMALFRRLGVGVETLSRREFSTAYFALARRYHPDHNSRTLDLMANINMARTCILRAYRWPEPGEPAPAPDQAKPSPRATADHRTPPPPRGAQANNGRPIFGRRVWPSAAPG